MRFGRAKEAAGRMFQSGSGASLLKLVCARPGPRRIGNLFEGFRHGFHETFCSPGPGERIPQRPAIRNAPHPTSKDRAHEVQPARPLPSLRGENYSPSGDPEGSPPDGGNFGPVPNDFKMMSK